MVSPAWAASQGWEPSARGEPWGWRGCGAAAGIQKIREITQHQLNLLLFGSSSPASKGLSLALASVLPPGAAAGPSRGHIGPKPYEELPLPPATPPQAPHGSPELSQ